MKENDNKSEKDIQEDILNKENQKQKLKKELSEVINDINELITDGYIEFQNHTLPSLL